MRVLVSEILFWTCAAACIVAQYYIVRAVVRPGVSTPLDENPHVSQSIIPSRRQSGRLQELVWVLLPAVLLALVFVFAWRELPR